ncbi:MAG: methionyl-tRNA formyltransferase [Leeuwenhoekiella sp.]
MRDLRIVFMGTPDFAVASLKAIVEAKYNVVGVITAPDRPAGRGQKLRESAVKEYAAGHNLKVLQPTNLKNEAFLKELEDLRANLQVVVAFRMLPQVVWQLPEYGTFNLHASILPDYRGAAPINWAIINGENRTGATTFFIDEKIDTGEIILQKEIDIKPDENAGSLHDRLMVMGAQLITETIALIASDNVKTKPQPKQDQINTAYKLDRDNTKINWDAPIEKIYNLIRGLSPYPIAWSNFENNGKMDIVKIYAARMDEKNRVDLVEKSIGEIKVIDDKIQVNLKDGVLIIDELQLPGKRKMKSKDLLNGYNFSEDSKML